MACDNASAAGISEDQLRSKPTQALVFKREVVIRHPQVERLSSVSVKDEPERKGESVLPLERGFAFSTPRAADCRLSLSVPERS